MNLTLHPTISKVFVLTLVLIGQAHAQLLPGIQQSGPVQLDPKAQQQQDLKRRLESARSSRFP